MAGKNPAMFALLYVETILFEKSAEHRSRTEWKSQTVPGQTLIITAINFHYYLYTSFIENTGVNTNAKCADGIYSPPQCDDLP